MSKRDTYNTRVPMFPGFYETWLEPSYPELYEIVECDIIPNILNEEVGYYTHTWSHDHLVIAFYEAILDNLWNEIEYSFKDAEQLNAEDFVDIVEGFLYNRAGIDINIPYKSLVIKSPSYYNFENDWVECELEADPLQLRGYVTEHYDAFEKYCKDRFTSCDGFISFLSNDAKDWMAALDDLCCDEEGEELSDIGVSRLIQCVLEFIMYNEDNDYWKYSEWTETNNWQRRWGSWELSPELKEFCGNPKVVEALKEYIKEYEKTKEYLKDHKDRSYFNKLNYEYLHATVDELVKNNFEK